MSIDPQVAPPPIPPPQTPASLGEARTMAIVCYALFIAVFTNGITGIIGVVLAYIKRAEARGTVWESHFTNLIHVFWSGIVVFVLFMAAAGVAALGIFNTAQSNSFSPMILILPVLWLGMIGYLVWYLYRTVKGLIQALDNKPYA